MKYNKLLDAQFYLDTEQNRLFLKFSSDKKGKKKYFLLIIPYRMFLEEDSDFEEFAK